MMICGEIGESGRQIIFSVLSELVAALTKVLDLTKPVFCCAGKDPVRRYPASLSIRLIIG